MVKELVQAVVGPVVAGFWSHLNLTPYGSLKYLSANRAMREYGQEQDYWRDLIARDSVTPLQLGDVVKLRGFQLTEWVPRAPGVWWTDKGQHMRNAATGYCVPGSTAHTVYSPRGKYLMVSGGVGTNRFLSHKGDAGRYRLVCATSSGICDAGIPIAMLDDVYLAIQEPLTQSQGLEVDASGRIAELPFDAAELVLLARGSRLENDLRDFVGSSLHVPRYVLVVESTLQVKKYVSDFQLSATAWTLYGAQESDESIQPSFTFCSFDPRDANSIDQSADFLRQYIKDYRGKITYTDFDEHKRRLDARHFLDEIMNRSSGSEDLREISKWVNVVSGFY